MFHILLAEDNRGDVLLIREALERHNVTHELHVFLDGQAMLDYAMSIGGSPPTTETDLLLLDLNLPKLDGLAVLQRFRDIPACTHTPVIIVTSSNLPRDRDKLAHLGISHYFRKPVGYEAYMQLGGIVRQVLAQHTA